MFGHAPAYICDCVCVYGSQKCLNDDAGRLSNVLKININAINNKKKI